MTEQVDLKAFSLLGHKSEVEVAVAVFDEDRLAVDAAVGEVVCDFRCNAPQCSPAMFSR